MLIEPCIDTALSEGSPTLGLLGKPVRHFFFFLQLEKWDFCVLQPRVLTKMEGVHKYLLNGSSKQNKQNQHQQNTEGLNSLLSFSFKSFCHFYSSPSSGDHH